MIKWRVYRFDCERYEHVRGILSAGPGAQELEDLASTPELELVAISLSKRKIKFSEACHKFVFAHCCHDTPIDIDRKFVRMIKKLRASSGTRNLGDSLRSIFIERHNVDGWLTVDGLLIGFLTAAETIELNNYFKKLLPHINTSQPGFVPEMQHIMRLVFNRELDPALTLKSLSRLVARAAAAGEGIAVVRMM